MRSMYLKFNLPINTASLKAALISEGINLSLSSQALIVSISNGDNGLPNSCSNKIKIVPSSLFLFYLNKNSADRSEEHTSELQSRFDLVCRLLLEKKKKVNVDRIDNN